METLIILLLLIVLLDAQQCCDNADACPANASCLCEGSVDSCIY